ncbi:MAG: hypothetical protein R3A80_01550 [Bdellovibrionota bacterium]
MLRGVFFLLALYAFQIKAIDIAFFVRTQANGQIEVYEEGTLYSHVAIRVGDQWLEARPWYGVHLTNDTSSMGVITEILSDPSIPEPNDAFLEKVLGKKYFLFADWDDPEIYNCTKLVAKLLGIEPNPMNFDPMLWGNRFQEYLGKPGLSVGELYTELEERSFESEIIESKISGGCRKHLQ